MHARKTSSSISRLLLPLPLLLGALGAGAPGCAARESDSAPETGSPPAHAAIPAALHMAANRARQAAPGFDFTADGTGTLRSKAGRLGARADVAATPRGVRLTTTIDGGFTLDVATESVGRAGGRDAATVASERAEGQELVLEREGDVEERFLAGPLGIEQSYLIRHRPAGDGPLVVEVAFAGLVPAPVEGASDRVVLKDGRGRVRGGYRDLVASDAAGAELASQMEVRGSRVALVIDDAKATYPLRVDPLVWIQQAELVASDGAAEDEFGSSVAVSGDTAVVGAPFHDVGDVFQPGAAYVFVRNGASWTEQAELTASDGDVGAEFGWSVAANGDLVLVGAPTHMVNGVPRQGAAYLFVRSGVSWTEQAELVAADGAAYDDFGNAVALSGTTVLVGAPGRRMGGNLSQGAAYVFVASGDSWVQAAELTAADGGMYDTFGSSVALSGTTAVVGALNRSVSDNSGQGAAFVFGYDGSSWVQQAELTAADGAAAEHFAYSVAVDDGTIVVGAPDHRVGANTQQGAVYMYANDGASWLLQAELVEDGGMSSDGFGRSVAIRGTRALLGAPGHHVNPTGSSTAYIYEDGDTGWLLQSVLSATDAVYGDDFAASVALTDGVALVGAFQHKVGTNVRAGSAYVFAAEATNGDACVTDGDCRSGHCVDAVCCDTPCGGGSSTDCLSCLGAMTGGADGTCGTVTAAAGFACRPSVGPCDPAETCDGSSSACPADAHEDQGTACPDDGNACTSDACDENGTCQHPSLADGTPCGDGEVCGSGSCASACFIDGALYPAGTVNAANPCLVCRPATSTTMWSNASEGTACDDGDACTQTDACQAGACTGGNPVTCTPMDDCHLAGVCDSATGSCSNPSKPDGEPCAGGTCQAGTCTPTDATTSSGTGGGPATGSGTGGGATTSSGASSTSTTGAGGSGGASAGGGGTPAQSGGCGCAVPGDPSNPGEGAVLLAIALAGSLERRRRKRCP